MNTLVVAPEKQETVVRRLYNPEPEKRKFYIGLSIVLWSILAYLFISHFILMTVEIKGASKPVRVYELAGPQVYDYRSLLLLLGKSLGRERLLLPVPFALWKIIGTIGQLLPAPPITRSQVELMECDNIASPGVPGFANLGMTPRSLEEILPQINPGHGRAPEPAAP